MKHLEAARDCLIAIRPEMRRYVILNDNNLTFIMQNKPVAEVGVNGMQNVDLLRFIKYMFESLNEKYPCYENEATVKDIEDAINKQQYRIRKKSDKEPNT